MKILGLLFFLMLSLAAQSRHYDQYLFVYPDNYHRVILKPGMVIRAFKDAGFRYTRKKASEVTINDLKNSNVFLCGGMDVNSVSARILNTLPVKYHSEQARLTINGDDFFSVPGLMLRGRNPFNPDRVFMLASEELLNTGFARWWNNHYFKDLRRYVEQHDLLSQDLIVMDLPGVILKGHWQGNGSFIYEDTFQSALERSGMRTRTGRHFVFSWYPENLSHSSAQQALFELDRFFEEKYMKRMKPVNLSLFKARVYYLPQGIEEKVEFPYFNKLLRHSPLNHGVIKSLSDQSGFEPALGFSAAHEDTLSSDALSSYNHFFMIPETTIHSHFLKKGISAYCTEDLDKAGLFCLHLYSSDRHSQFVDMSHYITNWVDMDYRDFTHKVAGSMISFLIDRYGHERFWHLCSYFDYNPFLRQQHLEDFNSAFEKVYGFSFERLEKEWDSDLKRRRESARYLLKQTPARFYEKSWGKYIRELE